MQMKYFSGAIFLTLLVCCASAWGQAAGDEKKAAAAGTDEANQENEEITAEYLEELDARRAFLKRVCTHLCTIAQKEPLEGQDHITAGISAMLGFAVPLPGPDGPVDYAAWIRSLSETDDNAAAPYFEDAKMNFRPWTGDDDLLSCALDGDDGALFSREMIAWLAGNEPALNEFLAGGQFDYRGNIEIEDAGDKCLFAGSGRNKYLTYGIRIKSNLLIAHGDYEEALRLLCESTVSGSRLTRNPAGLEPFWGIAIQSQSCWEIANLIAADESSAIDYIALADLAGETLLAPGSCLGGFRVSQAEVLDGIQRLYRYDGESKTYALRDDYLNIWQNLDPDFAFLNEKENEIFVRAIQSHDFYHFISRTNIDFDIMTLAVQGPFKQGYLVLRLLEKEVDERKHRLDNPFLYYYLRPVSRMYQLWTAGASTVAATRVIIDLKAYRQKHGEYPESLDVLSDREAGIDPFTGETFRYQRVGDDFTLYSLGTNGRYDDGKKDRYGEDGDIYYWPRADQ